MAETLESFLARQLRDVSEQGKSCRTIRLMVADSGQTFDRWDAPLRAQEGGPGPEKLAEEIIEICLSYADSFPAQGGPVMMAIVAEDVDGNERGRHLRKVTGTNRNGKTTMLGGDMSIAEGARIHVETTKSLLGAATAQNNLLVAQVKTLIEQTHALMLMGINDKMRQIEDQADRVSNGTEIDPQTKYVLEQLGKIAGPFAELVGPHLINKLASAPGPAPSPTPAPTAPPAPQVPPTPTNGAGTPN